MENSKEKFDKDGVSEIARSAGIAWIGALVQNVLRYISGILITRTIGAGSYGTFWLAYTITNIAGIFARLGLDSGTLRFVALYNGQNDKSRIKGCIVSATIVTFLSSLALGTLLFLFSDLIGNSIFHEPGLVNLTRLLAITLLFSSLGHIWISGIWGLQVVRYKVYIDSFAQPLLRLIILIALFLAGWRLLGVIVATLTSSIVGCFMALCLLLRLFPFHKKTLRATFEHRELIKYSVPLLFTSVLLFVVQWVDVLMIGYFLPAADVGIYSVASKIAMMITLVLTTFNIAFAPIISELYGKREMRRMEELFKTTTRWIFSLSFPIFLLITLFAKPIMSIFGASFSAGAICLVFLGIGRLIDAAVGAAGYVLIMTGRPKIGMINCAITAIMNIALNYVFIARYGISGAAIATGISIAFINLLQLGQVYYFLGIHPYKLSFIKPLMAGVASVLPVWLISNLMPYSGNVAMLLFLSFMFAAMYVFSIKLLGFDEEDRYILRIIRRRFSLAA